jgi:hypothetical protein
VKRELGTSQLPISPLAGAPIADVGLGVPVVGVEPPKAKNSEAPTEIPRTDGDVVAIEIALSDPNWLALTKKLPIDST